MRAVALISRVLRIRISRLRAKPADDGLRRRAAMPHSPCHWVHAGLFGQSNPTQSAPVFWRGLQATKQQRVNSPTSATAVV